MPSAALLLLAWLCRGAAAASVAIGTSEPLATARQGFVRSPSGTTASHPPEFAEGATIVVHGLLSKEGKRHNGRRGVVNKRLESGRYAVQVEAGPLLKVKPTNLQSATQIVSNQARPQPAKDMSVALLLPDTSSHTRLVLQPEGVDWLSSLQGPVALVSVVGAYRTGKSFLLNELMDVGCSDGFTVGHRRDTQTKGVWLSRRIRRIDAPGVGNTTIVYVDTEGFEGTGQASVYDDRIFAFATLVSSVIIYNLVETIKEADISRLAFSAQLSQEFLRRASKSASTFTERDRPNSVGSPMLSWPQSATAALEEWTPPALLWLVQRDFLQGEQVDAYLRRSLKPKENPADEAEISLNKVRQALTLFRNMQGLGLPQPHAKRTELCKLKHSELDPDYTKGLADVRSFVRRNSEPKLAAQQPLDGKMLAALTTRLVDALNAQKIPSAASVIDAFNSGLLSQVLQDFRDKLQAASLPMRETALIALHSDLLTRAESDLLSQSFGVADVRSLRQGAAQVLTAAKVRSSTRRGWGGGLGGGRLSWRELHRFPTM